MRIPLKKRSAGSLRVAVSAYGDPRRIARQRFRISRGPNRVPDESQCRHHKEYRGRQYLRRSWRNPRRSPTEHGDEPDTWKISHHSVVLTWSLLFAFGTLSFAVGLPRDGFPTRRRRLRASAVRAALLFPEASNRRGLRATRPQPRARKPGDIVSKTEETAETDTCDVGKFRRWANIRCL